MTVVEFLLARLDEQYRSAADAWRMNDEDRYRFLLADVEAKRDIIDACEPLLGDYPTSGAALAYRVLGYLALPYADHEQFREEWRP